MSDSVQYKFCTQCGAKLKSDARFCTQCGTRCTDFAENAPQVEKNTGAEAFALGHKYLKGDGVPKDFVAAQKAFQDAAQAGHKEAPVWVDICQHYLDIIHLRKIATAIHNGEDVAYTGAGMAAPQHGAAPHNSGEQHTQGNHSSRRGGSNLGKYAAGAVVGAAAASLLHGNSQAARPYLDNQDEDQTSADDSDLTDTVANDDADTQYSDDSTDSSSTDDAAYDGDSNSDSGGGFFDNLFGGSDNDDGGGFFGGGGDDDGGGFFGGGDDGGGFFGDD